MCKFSFCIRLWNYVSHSVSLLCESHPRWHLTPEEKNFGVRHCQALLLCFHCHWCCDGVCPVNYCQLWYWLPAMSWSHFCCEKRIIRLNEELVSRCHIVYKKDYLWQEKNQQWQRQLLPFGKYPEPDKLEEVLVLLHCKATAAELCYRSALCWDVTHPLQLHLERKMLFPQMCSKIVWYFLT